jgi:UDPglucose--hexose-1-phosphate uridylyltransferase
MSDFSFLEDPFSGKWVISAPRRAKRPDEANGIEPSCPFCAGREGQEPETYRVGGEPGDQKWKIRVINNKYPFAPIHEIVIHSQDHYRNFDELTHEQNELIIKTFRERFLTHKDKGQVVIFHNHGEKGGESLPHPHTQIAVVPNFVKLGILHPRPVEEKESFETDHFTLFCPETSEWPDEVWIRPKVRGRMFYEIEENEISDFAKVLHRITQIFELRHGNNFPFNFYIYPGGDWYLRLTPRVKSIGGFEIATGVSVNTQLPSETLEFIKTHFVSPDAEKIKHEYQAEYSDRV